MVNQSTPSTSNRGYRKPGDPTENWQSFIVTRLGLGFDDIDTDVDAIESRVTDNEADITTLDGRLDTAESDINTLESGVATEAITRSDNDITQEFSPVISSVTRDGSGKITGLTSGNVAISSIVRDGDGKISTWTETATLSGGSEVRNYTLSRDGNGKPNGVSYVNP